MFEWFTEFITWIISFFYSLFGWDSKKVTFEDHKGGNAVVEDTASLLPTEESKTE
jgi:hypothetical protein